MSHDSLNVNGRLNNRSHPLRATDCQGYILKKDQCKRGRQTKTCLPCKTHRNTIRREMRKTGSLSKINNLNKTLRNKNINMKRKNQRLQRKNQILKEKVENMRVKCVNVKEDAIREVIAMLPEKEKLAVEACLSAARCKSGNGIRYTTQWIYECLLLRIKSKKAYSHLRRHKILILPSLQTLHRYMKVIKGTYGFQDYVFEALKQKTANMSPQSVRGVLSLHEMKLSKALKFNAQTLQFEGFTNLGKYTPEHQKGTRGDHALVIMFQPFRGKWVQSLACFLSKCSASSDVLHKLIIEFIILAENAGLYIDAVTTDGASWNRSMWNLFGVDKETVSVTHVVDDSRRLWFLSDFPHLIKCIRNFVVKHLKYDPISTPDGFTFLKHWFALLLIEDPESYNIKVNFKLRKEHIQPKYFQKMNVALAFQFFGVADTLEVFRNRHEDLKDCEIQLCRRIKGLITAMNSRTPLTALSTGNKPWQIITEFLDYLEKWKSITKETGHRFITQNSYYGLMISLKATLQICTFLVDKCGFDYLMTARLNQDSLERFFGMMRDSCASNDHPDANLFIQMYRLISTYSVVKPPKGCNVSGGELLDVLLNIKEIGNINERKEQFESQIDTILDTGCGSNVLNNAVTLIQDHDYCESEASSYALSYTEWSI